MFTLGKTMRLHFVIIQRWCYSSRWSLYPQVVQSICNKHLCSITRIKSWCTQIPSMSSARSTPPSLLSSITTLKWFKTRKINFKPKIPTLWPLTTHHQATTSITTSRQLTSRTNCTSTHPSPLTQYSTRKKMWTLQASLREQVTTCQEADLLALKEGLIRRAKRALGLGGLLKSMSNRSCSLRTLQLSMRRRWMSSGLVIKSKDRIYIPWYKQLMKSKSITLNFNSRLTAKMRKWSI